MQFIAVQKNTRQAPRKVRLVANTIKKMELPKAIEQLAVMERRASTVVLKTLHQAIANAKNNHGVDPSDLVIKEITIGTGPTFKRFRAVSRGRAHGILKRSSHVRVVLEDKPKQKAEPAKKEAKPAAKKATKKTTTKTKKSKK
jgi:large subunit ribosomal protein L22